MTTVIIQTISRIMVPFIQLFGLYIIMHDLVSPGGGFQGGVIISASMILLALTVGMSAAGKRASHESRLMLISSGAVLYAMIGVMCILAGGNFLEYSAVPIPMMSAAEIAAQLVLAVGIFIGIHNMAAFTTIVFHLGEERE